MKTYKTWEAIEMLKNNPKLKFKSGDGEPPRTYRILEVSDTGYLYYKIEKFGQVYTIDETREAQFDGNLHIDTDWELVQEPVDFMTAAKAFREGKNVRCEYFKTNEEGEKGIDIFRQASDTRKGIMRADDDLTFYMAVNGKWYIEGEE